MKSFFKAAVSGLLWLTFSAAAFADTLYFTSQKENVEQGGQFTAYLASNPSQELYTYCVDYLNDISITSPPSGYPVNVTDLANSSMVALNTRYGQTPASGTGGFSTNTVVVPPSIGTAQDRYAMAAWLITQYNFGSGVTRADDQIQNAIWTLLDTNNETFTSNGGIGTYVTQAETWINGEISAGTLAAFENHVVIYSSTSIPGTPDPGRWCVGDQEMIGFVPEPSSIALLGGALLALGAFRKRIKVG